MLCHGPEPVAGYELLNFQCRRGLGGHSVLLEMGPDSWDAVKRISHKQCHMYENYPGVIRLPSILHKSKIGAEKLSKWWKKFQASDNTGTNWQSGRRNLEPFLDKSFFV